jgi:hypothetical protein
MTDNPKLLNLHAYQQHPIDGENLTLASGWIKSLSYAIMHQLKNDTKILFHLGEFVPQQSQQVTKLSGKLDAFAKILDLMPYDDEGNFTKLLLVSYTEIRGAQAICPNTIVCIDKQCAP